MRGSAAPPRARPLLEDVEERILYAADHPLAAAAAVATLAQQETVSAEAQSPTSAAQSPAVELVFIDARVPDADTLVRDIQAQATAGRAIEVVRIGENEDGIAAISAALQGRSEVSAVHLIAHGGEGSVQLGNTTLDQDALLQRAEEISGWGRQLEADADLLIYGCDVAAGADGRALVQNLAQLTGADVAASEDLTGFSGLGGNWTLEMQTGHIEAQLALGLQTQAQWQGLLATYTVTSTADSGAGTLRQAISDANANAGADTIVFNIAGAGLQTINLSTALPTITGALTINGYTQSDATANSAGSGSNAIIRIALNGSGAGAGANGLNFGSGSSGSVVSGLAIGGFTGAGILTSVGGLTVTGNFIGTDAAGSTAAANAIGVSVAGTGATTIGGSTAAARNLIAGNTNNVVSSATGTLLVQGNLIGTTAAGTAALTASTSNGISVSAGTANQIGGVNAGEGNVIMGGAKGVVVTTAGTVASILGNTIAGVSSIGIDLGDNGSTANDAGDPDTGANALQNFPVLTAAQSSSSGTGYVAVQGTLNSTANTSFRIEFYATPSGTGTAEGRIYLGYVLVTTNASGNATIAATLSGNAVATGALISATATRTGTAATVFYETSEFSAYRATTAMNEQVVTTTADSGAGSLRAAITAANAASGPTLITFNISGNVVHTITLSTLLPTITKQVVIDGTTDTGSVTANGGRPAIVINVGGIAGDGLRLDTGSGGSTIRGLVIQNYASNNSASAIRIMAGSSGNTIVGNYLGAIGADGEQAAVASGDDVIWIQSSNNIVGGSTAADRNVLGLDGTAAGFYAILIESGNGNQILGNYAGVNASGTTGFTGLQSGIWVNSGSSANTRIENNLISGAGDAGIAVNTGGGGTLVLNNRIGINAAGTGLISTTTPVGIIVYATGAGMVISGNWIGSTTTAGISLQTDGITVQGNRIGTDLAGTANWGGKQSGIRVAGSNNLIGGTLAGQGNIIAFSNQQGTTADAISVSSGTGNAILGNSIYSTNTNAGSLGIDLGASGVTANDAGDADTGANNLQNFPVLTVARTDGAGNFTITGTINSTANTYIRIEVFSNTSNTVSGYGEGRTLLGFINVLTDASGNASFSTTLSATVAVGAYISATATKSDSSYATFSDTSEFAKTIVAISTTQNTLVVDTASDTVDGDTTSLSTLLASKGADGFISLREALLAINGTPAGSLPTLVNFSIAGSGIHTITLASALPVIDRPVVIDGTTDTASVAANGGRPAIVLNGNGAAIDGLVLGANADGSTIRGLVVTNLTGNAIWVQAGSDGNTIAGNYIGRVGANGLSNALAVGNGIRVEGANNTIGGSTSANRNILAGLSGSAIRVSGASAANNVVQGNWINVLPDGVTSVASTGDGITAYSGATNTRIGGLGAGEGNWIVRTSLSAAGGVSSTGTLIQGNRIGTDLAGTSNWGTTAAGVYFSGTSTGSMVQGNTIAFSGANGGVLIDTGATGVALLQNSIYSSGGLGIDLGFNGVTANDTGDADSGPNNLQNYPVLAVASTNGAGSITVIGSINSTANSFFRIELFANTSNDASGYGEGQTYLGFINVSTDASGNATFSTTLSATVAVGAYISATATRTTDNTYSSFTDTSEFAKSVVAISTVQNTLVVDTASDTVDGDTTSLSTLLASKGADGFISLREALLAINGTPAGSLPTLVNFAIAGTGVHTITLTSALPTIDRPVVLNATTDDSFAANGNRPAIVLDGNNGSFDLLTLGTNADGSTIRGFVFTNSQASGINIQAGSDGNTVAGNYFGKVGASGLAIATTLGYDGILVSGANNTIGGTTAADRNLLAGSGSAAIDLQGSSALNNTVLGNWVGLLPDGATTVDSSGVGIRVGASAQNNRIGGLGAGEGNVVVRTAHSGIVISDATGTVVQGNRTGTNLAGTATWGMAESGIYITAGAANSLVQGNVVAYSQSEGGIVLSSSAGTGNSLLGNSIYGNTGLGIDLNVDGVTANDTGDADSGPNNLQNFPVLTVARTNGAGNFEITGTINSTANSYIRIEIFANTANDSTGYGEGQTYLGFVNVLTDGSGNATFSTTLTATVAAGAFISATATKSVAGYGSFSDTSEFAKSLVAISSTQAVLVVDTAADTLDGDTTSISTLLASKGADGFISLREAIIAINNTPAGSLPTLVNFSIAGNAVHTITLGSELPAITKPVVIDGTTDTASYTANGNRPAIVLQGNGSGSNWVGLNFASGSGGSTVRGLVIRGFDYAIRLQSGSSGNTIVGNYIGPLQADGSYTSAASAQTTWGISVESANNTIGGTTTADRNVITGMLGSGAGVVLQGAGATGNRVIGNYLGTNASGTPQGVGSEGVYIRSGAQNNQIGGTAAGEGNLIAGSSAAGVAIVTGAGAGNAILGNSIYSNGGLGIDLAGGGVTANDTGDADTGPNNRQNFPVVASVSLASNQFTVTGSLNSEANKTYRIEFFGIPYGSTDGSGNGEGNVYLGFVEVTTDASGNASISTTLAASGLTYGAWISATATEKIGASNYGSTSEFSANVQAANTAPVLTVAASAATTENAAAVALAPGATAVDSELAASGNYAGATLTLLRNGGANAQDLFAATGGSLAALTQGGNLVYGGTTVGTVTTNSGGTLVLSFNSNATQTLVNNVLRAIGYANSSDDPPASVLLSWSFSDGNTGAQGGGGALASSGSTTVNISAVNDAPVLTTSGTTLAYTENAAATAIDMGLAVSDVDNTSLAGATVTISANYANGQDVLAFVDQNGITGNWNATTGVLTLSGAASVANYQAALRSVSYVNTSDNPSTATRTVSFTVNDGVANSTAATRNIAVTAVNDAPVVTTTGSTLGYTENAAATAIDAGVSVSDVDNTNLSGATVSISVNYVNGEDVLAFTNANGITGSWNATTGVLTLSGSATVANYQAALRSVSYVNTSENPSTATRTVSFSASDGSATSAVATRDISVTAVNDVPVVSTTVSALAITENDAATAIDAAVSVSDVDNTNLSGATVSISANYVNGQDVLAFTNANGITGSWDAATGVLTLSGSASVANYQAALRSISYVNTSDNPSTATRTVSFTVNDGVANSLAATRNIAVTAVNDAPVVATTGSTLATTENAAATAIDAGVSVSDVDNTNLSGATVSISANYVNGEDVLAFTNANGITGSWNATTGVLTLSGSATVANYQAALRSVSYVNTSENPSTATRTVSFSASDGSATSAVATRDIAVTAVNDAPVVTATGSALAYTENTAATAVDAGVAVHDADSTNLTGASVSISANYVNGEDVLAFTNANGISGSWDAATGVLTLTGSASVANYQLALRSITYVNTSDNPSTATRTVSFVVNDGVANSTAATRSIAVTAVNDAPVVATTGSTLATTENAAATAIDAGLVVSDADHTSLASATIMISGNYVNGQDVLAFVDQNGITGNWDAATGVLTLSGSASVANYQAALRSVSYVNTSDNPSTATRTVSFTVNDGTLNSAVVTRNIAVTALNDAPVLTTTGSTLAITENAAATVVDGGLTVSDADNTNLTGATVAISANYVNGEDQLAFTNANGITGSWNATTGVLTLTGSATLADYQAALRSITYVNTSDNPSTATRSVSFTVNDGTVNSAAATRNIAITAVNDAPVVSATGSTLSYTENAAATPIDAGLTLGDVDNALLVGATVSLSANYVNGEDQLAFTNANGITGNWDAATGVLTLTGSASVADYQTALRSVSYVNTSDNPSTATRSVSFTVNDGTLNSAVATRNIAITAVNDAPVLTPTGSTLNYTENAAATPVDAGLTLGDVDNSLLVGATVSLSANYANGQDVLAFINANGITGSWDAATGILSLSGTATLADYQAALRSVTYSNTSDNPSTATRTVSFVVSDGTANSLAAIRSLAVAAVNDAPVLTTTGSALAYTESTPATPMDPGLTIADVDNSTLTGATISISGNYVNGEDVLAFTNANGISGSWDVATGVLTLTGSASVTNYQAALRSVTYINTSDNPSTATRSVSFVVNDGVANSTAATRNIALTAVNDAPVVTTTGTLLAYTENDPATAVDPGLVVSDVDSPVLAGASIAITANYDSAHDMLGFTDGNGITGSWDGTTGVMTLSGTATVADYQAALRSVVYLYTDTSGNSGTVTRTVTFTVSDGTATSLPAARNLGVTSVNNAPDLVSTGTALGYTENAAAMPIDTGLTVSDVDNTTLTGASVAISVNYANGQDLLAFTDSLGITGSWNAATGVLTLSGNASLAAYQAALRSVSYINTSDNPSTATRTVSFTASDGTDTSLAATRDIVLSAVNDAAQLTATGTALGYAENAGAAAIDPGLVVSDVDNTTLTGARVAISVNYANGQDVLAFVDQNGITGSWDAATGVLTLSGTASVADYQAALRSISYVNSSDNPSTATRTVAFTVNDGSLDSLAVTRDIAITTVNDAPVVATTGSALAITENDAATAIDPGVAVSDADNTTLSGATVHISTNYVNGEDLLAFSNANGITGSWDAASGTLTLSGTATVADYQAALRSLSYINTSDNPSTATRTVVFTVSDGVLSSLAATRDITITAINDAPVVTTSGTAQAYTENAAAVLIDTGVTVGDVDNSILSGATITITGNYANGEDVLAFVNANGITGSWDAATGVLTLTGNASVANYQAALRSVTYTNTSDKPSTATRSVSFVVSDGAANSTVATRSIAVTAVNDPPVVSTGGAALAYTENDATTPVAPGLGLSDADDTLLTGATVSISANYAIGQDVLAFTNANGISGNWNAATGVLTLTGSASVADYQAALRSVSYVNTSDDPGTATRTLSFVVNDGQADSIAATRDIAITGVNDAPVVSTSGTVLAYAENANPTPIDPGLTVADADNNNLSGATVTISVNYANGQDVLAFTNANGITGSWDAASGVLTLSGNATVAAYQAALRSVTYANTSDNPSTAIRTLSFSVSDGSASSAAATRNLSVTSVSDAPMGADNTVTTLEDTPYTFTLADFGFSDLDGGVLQAVRLSALPGVGSLSLNGVAVSAGQMVAVADIVAGKLVFTPAANANGPGYTSFSFQVQDDGGTANGGADTDPTPRTMTIAVTPVNDGPVITSNGGGATAAVAMDENHTAVTTVLASDIDGPALSYSISGGADAALFSIDSTTGALRFIAAPNYEAAASAGGNNIYQVVVQASDGLASATQTITVTVLDVNEFAVGAPADTDAAANTVAENAATGTLVGITAHAADLDGTATVSYSLSNDAGGRFTIDAVTGVVTVANGSLLDYEGAANHTITVRATSSDGSSASTSFTVHLGDVNEAPLGAIADVNPAANQVPENAATGTPVGITAQAVDTDGTATVSYTLSNDAGGRFSIDPATGVVTVADGSLLDYEGQAQYQITVLATSSDGSSSTLSFTVQLADVNEAPVGAVSDVDPAADSLPENATTGTLVGITAHASDPDGTATVSYSLSNDAGGRFSIDAVTGVVTVANGSLLDFEAATSHQITVLATSSDGSVSSASFIIALTNVNEAVISPVVDTDAAPNRLPENAATGTAVGITAFARDPDAGATVSYTLLENAGGRFTIDATTGVVTVADGSLLNYEAAITHGIVVRATSSDGSTTDTAFVVQLSDVNEAPVGAVSDVDPAADSLPENATTGTLVGITAQAIDPDGTATVSYSLSDNAGGRFTIDAVTGVVSVADGSLLDNQAAATYGIVVRATSSDGSTSDTAFVVQLSQLNQAPLGAVGDADPAANLVPAGAGSGSTIGITAHAVSPDGTVGVRYSLSDNAGGRFAIDALTGVVTVANSALMASDPPGTFYNIMVQAASSDGATRSAVFSVQLPARELTTPGPVLTEPGDLPIVFGVPAPVVLTGATASFATAVPNLAMDLSDGAIAARPSLDVGSQSDPTAPALDMGSHGPLLPYEVSPQRLLPSAFVSGLSERRGLVLSQFDDLTEEFERLRFAQGAVRRMDDLPVQLDSVRSGVELPVGESMDVVWIGSMALSLGIAIWAARGSSLLTSMLATTPAWQNFDPVPVLRNPKADRGPAGRQRHDDPRRRTAEDSMAAVETAGAEMAQAEHDGMASGTNQESK
ncbi:cadherin domain-containing protein [Variovorax sp. HJSM1_2]|uniref:cadherin domain-containing protein n=1 Tax=Variovorax sp. HJSM1_2 TaxID=3366263 RepID=UPI003BDC613C